jgi:hypothetical protein
MWKTIQKIFFKKRYQQLIDAENIIAPHLDTKYNTNNKLSIAFCISGHIRDYRRLHKNYLEFKNLINQYGDIDVFIATWNKQNSANCWSGAHGLSEPGSHNIDINVEDIIQNFEAKEVEVNDYAFYASEFSPLQWNILTKCKYNWDGRGIHNGVIGSCKMFYLIYKANLLKLQSEYKNNKKYDWVFRLRPDMRFDIEECRKVIKLDMLDNNKIYIPKLHDDTIAYGGSHIMNKYSNAIIRMIKEFDNNLFGPPEEIIANILLDFIEKENIVSTVKYGSLLAEHKTSLLPLR